VTDKRRFTACEKVFEKGMRIPAVAKIAVKRSRTGGQCDKKPQFIQEKFEIYREGKNKSLYLKTIPGWGLAGSCAGWRIDFNGLWGYYNLLKNKDL